MIHEKFELTLTNETNRELLKYLNFTLATYEIAVKYDQRDFFELQQYAEKRGISLGLCNFLIIAFPLIAENHSFWFKAEIKKTYNDYFVPDDNLLYPGFFFPIIESDLQITPVEEIKRLVFKPRIELLKKTIERLQSEIIE